MSARDIQRGDATSIDIYCGGDLSVKGWDQSWIQLGGDEIESAPTESAGGAIRVRINGDGRLRIPAGLAVRILDASGDVRLHDVNAMLDVQHVAGDLRVENLNGELRIGAVNGDVKVHQVRGPATLQNVMGDLQISQIDGPVTCADVSGDAKVESVNGPIALTNQIGGDLEIAGIGGPTAIGTVNGDVDVVDMQATQIQGVNGDLTAKDIRGELSVGQVGGDAQIAVCAGAVGLENVGGDLTARELIGGIRATMVGGRIRLRTTIQEGQTYDLSAGGGATFLIEGDPSGLSAVFELRQRDGGRIDVGLPLEDSVVERGFVRGRIGSGSATVRMTAGGAIRVEPKGSDSHGFDGVMGGIFDEIGEGFRGAFGAFPGFGWGGAEGTAEGRGSRHGRRVEDTIEEATRRVTEAATRQGMRAAERAQRHMERALRQTERGPGNWRWFGKSSGPGPGWPVPPNPPGPPPVPPRPKATEEERLVILNMLAAGSITPEDAARLLESLGS